MPDFTSLNEFTGTALGVGALIALIAGWVKVVRPKWRAFWRKVGAAFDAIVGRDAITHPDTGRELVPAQPGIGVRMAHQEQQTELLVEAVAKLVDQGSRIRALEETDVEFESRIKALEEAAVERVVTKAESAAAWRAMEAVALSQPDLTIDPDSGD